MRGDNTRFEREIDTLKREVRKLEFEITKMKHKNDFL